MLTIDTAHQYPWSDCLFVFALDYEAGDFFKDQQVLVTGIGKVGAAYALTRAIHQQRPRLIINLGSAGSNHFKRGDIVCCTQFIQRDMDVRPLGFALYETPLSGIPPLLSYGLTWPELPTGICGTGDHFDTNHATTAYNLVDMEAYALALVAMKEEIPFLCLKYISDGADGGAAEEWSIQVHKAAEAFAALLFQAR